MPRRALALLTLGTALLGGCDLLGIETPEKLAAARDADGRAIGSACRHAARAIEDCYALNKKADKAAVFAGWRDMNDYMRENKIEPVAPQISASAPPIATAEAGPAERPRAADGKAANKASRAHES